MNNKEVLLMGELSSLAYKPWKTVNENLKLMNLSNFLYYDKENIEAFLTTDSQNIYVSFRGTNELADWITNLDVEKIKVQHGKVHKGFKEGLDLIFEKLFADVLHYSKNKSIKLCGHSLGGALAGEMSRRLWLRDIPHNTYTFGSPRCFNKQLAKWYNSVSKGNSHRYVNNNDVVPRVPPRFLDFSHVMIFHYFREDGEQDDNISWAWKLLDRIEGIVNDIGEVGLDAVKDHDMEIEYLVKLRKNISNAKT